MCLVHIYVCISTPWWAEICVCPNDYGICFMISIRLYFIIIFKAPTKAAWIPFKLFK